jgi:hypothetical protein
LEIFDLEIKQEFEMLIMRDIWVSGRNNYRNICINTAGKVWEVKMRDISSLTLYNR